MTCARAPGGAPAFILAATNDKRGNNEQDAATWHRLRSSPWRRSHARFSEEDPDSRFTIAIEKLDGTVVKERLHPSEHAEGKALDAALGCS
jgi:hypothetical protein